HLLDGCGDCQGRAKRVLELTGGYQVGPPSQALTVFLRESALLKDERGKAVANWARLAILDEKERIRVMKARWRFKKHGLASYVLDEAETLSAKGQKDKAKELVRFSAAITACLPRRVYGGPLISDLKLRQETVLSNIARLSFDFLGSLAAIQRAERAMSEGIDLVEKARFFRVQGMLLFDLG